MSTPELTIIISTHNRPDLLRTAVDSALGQDLDGVDVVVVDDGSDDPVQLPADPRLHVVRHSAARGGSAARNTGTKAATGRMITYLDDDDVLLHHMARTALSAHQQAALPPPVGVLTGIEVVDPAGRVLETRLPVTLPRGGDFWLEERQPNRSFFTKQTLVVERGVLLSVGAWDEAFRSRVHTDLFLKLNPVCSLLGVPLVTYRLLAHPGPRVSKDPAKRQESFFRLLDKHAAAFAAHPGRTADILVDHAVHSWRDRERGAAVASVGRALRRAPLRAARETAGRVRHEWREGRR